MPTESAYTGGMTPDELRALADHATTANDALRAGIIQAAREDMPQADICRATGLSREGLRKIERAAGLPARRQGRRPNG